MSRHVVERQLREHGIRVVVDLMGDDPENAEQPFERAALERLGIELHKCPLVGDGTGDWREYVAAVTAIVRAKEAGRPVLVHCYAGSQRTGGTFALYRLLVRREWTLGRSSTNCPRTRGDRIAIACCWSTSTRTCPRSRANWRLGG